MMKILLYHSGRVILQSNVSIGAGCTIDRGNFDDISWVKIHILII